MGKKLKIRLRARKNAANKVKQRKLVANNAEVIKKIKEANAQYTFDRAD